MLNPNSGGLEDDFPFHFGVIVRFQPFIVWCRIFFLFFSKEVSTRHSGSPLSSKSSTGPQKTQREFLERSKFWNNKHQQKSSVLPTKNLEGNMFCLDSCDYCDLLHSWSGLERLPSTPDSGAATVSPVQPATPAPAAPAGPKPVTLDAPAAPAPEAPMASAPAMLATEPAAPSAKRSSSKKATEMHLSLMNFYWGKLLTKIYGDAS